MSGVLIRSSSGGEASEAETVLGSADPAQPPGESQRSRQPAPLSPVLQFLPEPASQFLSLLGACKNSYFATSFCATRGEAALTPNNPHLFLLCLPSTHLQIKPLAVNMCHPFGVKNKCASILGTVSSFVYFPTPKSKCIAYGWRSFIPFPLQGLREFCSINS